MEKIDAVIAVLAVVAVVGSAVGLTTYESGIKTFNVGFPTSTVDQEETATLDGPGEATLEFDVTQRNLTWVNFTIEVSTDDALSQGRSVDVEAEAPNGTTMGGSGTLSGAGGDSVTVELAFPVRKVPGGFETQARSIDDVFSDLNATHAHDNGTGTWTVDVTVSGGPAISTATYDIAGTLEARFFEAEVTPRTVDPGTR